MFVFVMIVCVCLYCVSVCFYSVRVCILCVLVFCVCLCLYYSVCMFVIGMCVFEMCVCVFLFCACICCVFALCVCVCVLFLCVGDTRVCTCTTVLTAESCVLMHCGEWWCARLSTLQWRVGVGGPFTAGGKKTCMLSIIRRGRRRGDYRRPNEGRGRVTHSLMLTVTDPFTAVKFQKHKSAWYVRLRVCVCVCVCVCVWPKKHQFQIQSLKILRCQDP